MANDKLCFVLGAGASSHFGYPLGNELVEAMESFGKIISDDHTKEKQEIKNLIKQIKSYNPLSIDYYLYNNPKKAIHTKRLLEAVILHTQNKSTFEHTGSKLAKWWKCYNYPKTASAIAPFSNYSQIAVSEDNCFTASNWVKFIHHKIVANCETSDDVKSELENISVITFNYDVSFEHALWKYFKDTKFDQEFSEPSNKEECHTLEKYITKTFFEKNVIHVYGKINRREENYDCPEYSTEKMAEYAFCDYEFANGNNIDVIGIHKSIDTEGCKNCMEIQARCNRCIKIENCRTKLREARKTYFLGYAFDEFNNNVLNLKNVFKENASKSNQKLIYYTNYSNGLICDSSVRGFFDGKHIETLPYDSRITKVFNNNQNNSPRDWEVLITKSNMNVYEALEKDLNIPISYDYK